MKLLYQYSGMVAALGSSGTGAVVGEVGALLGAVGAVGLGGAVVGLKA